MGTKSHQNKNETRVFMALQKVGSMLIQEIYRKK